MNVRNVCKQLDYEGYLVSLFYPKKVQPHIWALRALNAECSTNIRKAEFYKLDVDNRSTDITKNLPPDMNGFWLSRMITSKTIERYESMEDLENYCEASFSSLLYLSLETIGAKDVNADHAISHIGKCTGLLNTIRGIGHFSRRKKCYLPLSLLEKYKLSQEDVFRQNLSNLPDLVHEIACLAHQHKETALDHIKSLPKEVFPVMLHVVPCINYLKNLDLVQFDVTDKRLYVRDAKLPLQLLYKNFMRAI
eukprot:NODE_229_length_12207_cov_1.116700.p7 type:complete len:250 gc:universal NODE_229_length_12207_cov_1.116700:10331-9582(-)